MFQIKRFTMSMKILVSGDVEGNLTALFKRVEAVNAKAGPFEMLLCVGSFFGPGNLGWGDYKSGRCKVPLPVYILGPTSQEQLLPYPDLAGCEICENVIHLGRQVREHSTEQVLSRYFVCDQNT